MTVQVVMIMVEGMAEGVVIAVEVAMEVVVVMARQVDTVPPVDTGAAMEVAAMAVAMVVVAVVMEGVMVVMATTRLLPGRVATETVDTEAAVDTAAPLGRTVTTVDTVVVEGTAVARERE